MAGYRVCHNCGYDLKGIARKSPCPECGALQGRVGLQNTSLAYASMPTITSVASRLTLIFATQVGFVLLFLALIFLNQYFRDIFGKRSEEIFFVVIAGITVLNAVARCSPFLIAPIDRSSKLLKNLRMATWIFGGLLLAVVVFAILLDAVGVSGQGVVFASIVGTYMCYGLLMSCSMWVTSSVDQWLGDQSAETSHGISWWCFMLASALFPLGAGIAWVMGTGSGIGSLIYLVTFLAAVVGIITALIGDGMALNSSIWSIRNKSHHDEIAQRRAAREAAKADEMASRMGEKVDSPEVFRTCLRCGYELRGIPLSSPCPECGSIQE